MKQPRVVRLIPAATNDSSASFAAATTTACVITGMADSITRTPLGIPLRPKKFAEHKHDERRGDKAHSHDSKHAAVGLKAFKPVFIQCISDIKQRERRYDIAHIAGELNNGLRHFDAECRKRKANSKRNQRVGKRFF